MGGQSSMLPSLPRPSSAIGRRRRRYKEGRISEDWKAKPASSPTRTATRAGRSSSARPRSARRRFEARRRHRHPHVRPPKPCLDRPRIQVKCPFAGAGLYVLRSLRIGWNARVARSPRRSGAKSALLSDHRLHQRGFYPELGEEVQLAFGDEPGDSRDGASVSLPHPRFLVLCQKKKVGIVDVRPSAVVTAVRKWTLPVRSRVSTAPFCSSKAGRSPFSCLAPPIRCRKRLPTTRPQPGSSRSRTFFSVGVCLPRLQPISTAHAAAVRIPSIS